MNERTRIKQKQYRIDHKEELAAKKKIYYLENKERILEYGRIRGTTHVEEKKEKAHEYYLKNYETMNARSTERARERAARARMQPERLRKDMLKEFKSKYSPWFEGHVKGVYQIDFD
jgi:hypothetical protein